MCEPKEVVNILILTFDKYYYCLYFSDAVL